MTRVLFVTGPGKASIENHFDLNAELVQTLRESGKEELLAALEFERSTVQELLHAAARAARARPRGLLRATVCRRPAVRGGARRFDHRHACRQRRRAAG